MNRLKNYTGLVRLLFLLIGVPLLAYTFGVKRTMGLWNRSEENRVMLESLKKVKTESTGFQVFPDISVANSVRSGGLLQVLAESMHNHGITAERYTPYLIASESDSELYAGELVVTGGYIALTRFLAEAEKKEGIGRIVSADYRITEHPQSRKRSLTLTLILQQITTISR